MDWSQASSQESDCHCHWVQSWDLGNGDGVSFLRSSYTADSVLPKRVPPTGSLGVPNHRFTLPCSVGLGLCPSAALGVKEFTPHLQAVVITGVPQVEEGLADFTALEHSSSQGGAGVHVHFHDCPSPACCLLAPSCPCMGPLDAHPSGGCFCSSHGDAWGCRGWQVWLCLFIYSTIVLGGDQENCGV